MDFFWTLIGIILIIFVIMGIAYSVAVVVGWFLNRGDSHYVDDPGDHLAAHEMEEPESEYPEERDVDAREQ